MNKPDPLKTCIILIILVLTFMINHYALAYPQRCTDFYFPTDKNGNVDWIRPVKVIIQNTPVYDDPTSSSKTSQNLDFNTSLMIDNAETSRVQVRNIASVKPLGWVDRSALLCAYRPMRSENGLEQKLFIRSATKVRNNRPATVKAHPSPDLKDCKGKCRELSRFSGYFVFDETDKSYLISDYYRLDEMSKLVGWISKKNGFIWDTAYGLRPKENFVFEEGPLKGQEKAVCAYPTIADALEGKNCISILGGDRWYQIEHRIPLIDHVEKKGKSFYKVVLPLQQQMQHI